MRHALLSLSGDSSARACLLSCEASLYALRALLCVYAQPVYARFPFSIARRPSQAHLAVDVLANPVPFLYGLTTGLAASALAQVRRRRW